MSKSYASLADVLADEKRKRLFWEDLKQGLPFGCTLEKEEEGMVLLTFPGGDSRRLHVSILAEELGIETPMEYR